MTNKLEQQGEMIAMTNEVLVFIGIVVILGALCFVFKQKTIYKKIIDIILGEFENNIPSVAKEIHKSLPDKLKTIVTEDEIEDIISSFISIIFRKLDKYITKKVKGDS